MWSGVKPTVSSGATVGLFGLFSQEEDDDSDAVPVSVKSAILTAQVR